MQKQSKQRQSKIDRTKQITTNQFVLSLMNKKRHTVICLEELYEDDTYIFRLIDFMPKEKTQYDEYHYLSMLAHDKTYDGHITNYMLRYMLRDVANKDLISITADILEINQHANCRMCPNIDPNGSSVSFEISKEKAIQLAVNINEEQKNPPMFNIYGENVKRLFKDSKHNCTTWAVAHFNKIGLSPTRNNLCGACLPDDAGDYTKSTTCSIL